MSNPGLLRLLGNCYATLDFIMVMDTEDDRRLTKLPFTGAFKAQFNVDETLWSTATYPDETTTDKIPTPPRRRHQSDSQGIRPSRVVPVEVRRGNPWQIYIDRFEQNLGTDVDVGQLRLKEPENLNIGDEEGHSAKLYAIRKFETSDARGVVNVVRRLQHENFINVSQIFLDGSTCYTVSNLDEISLHDFCKPKFDLSEIQMAAIISQVIFFDLAAVSVTDGPFFNSFSEASSFSTRRI